MMYTDEAHGTTCHALFHPFMRKWRASSSENRKRKGSAKINRSLGAALSAKRR